MNKRIGPYREDMTMNEDTRRRVEAATVKLLRMQEDEFRPIGCAVLVHDGLLLTVAHNVSWVSTGDMTLGGHYIERVRSQDGTTFLASVAAVEPVADIGVLGPADLAWMPEEADELDDFEEWANSAEPIMVRRNLKPTGTEAVHILTHTGKWIDGEVSPDPRSRDRTGSLILTVTEPIDSGTSGSPVVDHAGYLIGLVSTSSQVPFVFRALPHWVGKAIGDAGGLCEVSESVPPQAGGQDRDLDGRRLP